MSIALTQDSMMGRGRDDGTVTQAGQDWLFEDKLAGYMRQQWKDGDLKPNWNLKKNKEKKPPEDKHTQTSWELSTEPPQAFTTRGESTTAEEQAGFSAVADWSWCGPGELTTEAEQVGSDQDTDESLRARPRDKCQHCHRCLNVCVNGWQQTCKDDLNL